MKRNFELLVQYKVELFLIIYLVLSYFVQNVPNVRIIKPLFEDGVPPCYFIDYSTGFGGRRLIGSVVSFFFCDFMSSKKLFYFVSLGNIAMIVLFSVMVGRVLKKIKNSFPKEVYWGSLYLVLLYLCSPFAISFLFNWENLGRMELWQLIILLCYFMIKRMISDILKPFLLLICIAVSALIHPVFLSTYFPIYAITSIYDLNHTSKNKKYFYISFSICYLLFFILMAVMLFCSTSKVELEELVADMQSKTDITISAFYVKYIYYASLIQHLKTFVIPWLPITSLGILLEFTLLSPFFYILYVFLKDCFSCIKITRYACLFYTLALSLIVVKYVTAIDFGRWMAADITCLFFAIGYFAYERNQIVIDSMSKMFERIKIAPYTYISILLYIGLFEKVGFRFQPIITYAVNLLTK